MMKGILIVYAPAIESEILCGLEAVGQKTYTKFTNLQGVGGHSEPHLDTQVWPGTNTALFIVTDIKTKDLIMALIKKLKQEYLEDGIKAFVMPVEEEI